MSDTARDIQTFDPSSTEGLQELFEPGLLKESLDQSQGVLEEKQGVPVELAATYLGLSVSGVLKRLRKGVLPGFKVPSKRGEKWLVSYEGLPESAIDTLKDSFSVPEVVLLEPEESSSLLEGLLDDREESSGHAQNIIEESSKRADVDRALLEELRSRNSELETKLQAASWRNGYLESKLEERDIQIKLLTDSQQKPSWWQRFKAFFVK